MVEAVIECSKRNILHQDIKVENVLIDLDTGVAKLIDFGLGKFFDDPDELIYSYSGNVLSFSNYAIKLKPYRFLRSCSLLVSDRHIA